MTPLLLAAAAAAAPCEPAPLVVAEPMGAPAPGVPRCAWVDLDLAGRAFAQLPEIGIARGLALQRSRAEVGLRSDAGLSTRASVLVARSGGASGYVGIDGEALVPVVQIAEARWDWRETGLALAAGVVDDPWVMTIQPAWERVDVLRPLATDSGFLDRSDMGGWVSWTSDRALLSATVAATTGEGASRRERNGGTDLTGVIHVRPLEALDDPPVRIELAAFGREGSRGVGSAPDHRAGAALLAEHTRFEAGLEGLIGWGLRSDGTLRPAGASLWARTADAPVVALARVDRRTDRRDLEGAGQTITLLAGGPRLPLGSDDQRGYLIVGWEGRTYGPAARPIAGSEALAGSDLFFLQLGAHLIARGGLP